MSAKLVLYFSATEHTLYRFAGGALEVEATFGANADGLQDFRARLTGRKGALVYVLNYRRGTFLEGGALPFRLG